MEDKRSDFTLGTQPVTVSYDVTTKTLSWKVSAEGSEQGVITRVSAEDIFAVQSEGDTWTVHYIADKQPGVWTPTDVTFSTDVTHTGDVTDWVRYMKQAITHTDQDRPSRLLVFINPHGGVGKAVETYNEIAKPLFLLTGVTDDVIVTEDCEHAARVLQDYDLNTINGIISVGGDGTFCRVSTALMRRIMVDAGKDPDDSSQDLIPSHIKLGLFPGGTGNALVKVMMGTPARTHGEISYPTIVLQTILGHTTPGKLYTIHNNNHLVACCSIIFSYGLAANAFKRSEEIRYIGLLRYIVALFQKVIYFHQPHKVTVSYPQTDQEGAAHKDWVSESCAYKMISAYGLGNKNGRAGVYDMDNMSLVTMDDTGSRFQFLKYWYHAITLNPNTGQGPCFHRFYRQNLRIELPEITNPTSPCHMCVYDGEPIEAEHGLLEIRLQRDVFRAYGIGYSGWSHKEE